MLVWATVRLVVQCELVLLVFNRPKGLGLRKISYPVQFLCFVISAINNPRVIYLLLKSVNACALPVI